MPKKAGMEKWKKKRRQEYLEMKQYRYYIFCEGQQTEPQYFLGFKKLIEDNPIYKDMVLIEIEPCQAETMRVIGMAEEYVKKNKIKKGQIWCVYDKDSFPAEHFNGVVERAESLNKENPELQYHTAWSNECIEFWFLLHFAYYTANNHRTEYIAFLNDIKILRGGSTRQDQVVLSEYIRHQIHHPENTHNPHFTEQQLQTSIQLLRDFVQTIV